MKVCYYNYYIVQRKLIKINDSEGAPLVGSNPHFYNAIPKYINGVEGMRPDKEKHETFVLLESVGFLLYS